MRTNLLGVMVELQNGAHGAPYPEILTFIDPVSERAKFNLSKNIN